MRQPVQVLILPFRRNADGRIEFAALKRSDANVWQFIAGGAEDGETPAAAAQREAQEEARIPASARLFQLQSSSTVPVEAFPAHAEEWMAAGTFVAIEHAFAVDVTGLKLRLSGEHTELCWGTETDTGRLLRWDSNRNALWELARRLERGSL